MRGVRYIAAAALAIAAGAATRAQQPPAKRTFSPPPTTRTPARGGLDERAPRPRRPFRPRSRRAPALPHHSRVAGAARTDARLRRHLAEARRLDFDALSQEGKVDYVLLRTRIEYDAALLGRQDRVQREIAPLVPFSAGIVTLAENRQRLDFIGADAAVKALRGHRGEAQRGHRFGRRRCEHPAGDGRSRRAGSRHPQRRPRTMVRLLQRLRPGVHGRRAESVSGAVRAARGLRRDAPGKDRGVAARRRPADHWRTGRRTRRAGERRTARGPRQRRTHRRRPNRAGRSAGGPARRDDRLHAGTAHRDRQSRVRVVRSRDDEGVARAGLRRRLEEGAREGQGHLRPARRAAPARPRPRAAGDRLRQAARPRHRARRSPKISGA